METRCPSCGSAFSLDVAINTEAGSELMNLIANMPTSLSRPLFAYLGLFRPATRKLTWDRALKLATEVLALSTPEHLAIALSETVESLREKQQYPGWKPMRNHNYLKRVLESVEMSAVVPVAINQPAVPKGKLSKQAQAINALDT